MNREKGTRPASSLTAGRDAATEGAKERGVCAHSITRWEDLPAVLSPEQTAELLGCCSKTVRELCAQGRIAAFKGGARWFISRDRLKALTEGEAMDHD